MPNRTISTLLSFVGMIAVSQLFIACQQGAPTAAVTQTSSSPPPSTSALAPTQAATVIPPPTALVTEPLASPAASTQPVQLPTPACIPLKDLNLFAFTPDNERILTRAQEGVYVVHPATQNESFLKAPQMVMTAALSPDGETLAWSLIDNTIQLVRMADQSVIADLDGHTDIVFKLRFTPAGDRLVSASHDTWVRLWDMEGNEVGAFQPTGADDFPNEVLGIGISPDERQLASIPFDGPVKIWDLETYDELAEVGGTGGFDSSDAAFSPDGKYLAADLATGLYLWRLADGESLLDSPVNSMAAAFSPDGSTLAYADINANSDILLTSPDGSQLIRTLSGQPSVVWELVFSPDSRLLASSDGVELRVWRVEDGALIYVGKAACP